MIQITRREAEEAIRTLLLWIGEDPKREGLLDTPRRVVDAFSQYCIGYSQDPQDVLQKFFTDVSGYNETIQLNNIRFESHCEHHLAPIIGTVNVAYIPYKKIIGVSKIVKVVEILTKRLQVQEKMTIQIASAIDQALQPKGVAVVIDAQHHCISSRKPNSALITMRTQSTRGIFTEKNNNLLSEFLASIRRVK